jgi:tRNA nucleotidyltransferase/poly(A) polymerase
MKDFIKPSLIKLRNNFVAEGFDIRFVGGCVRDYQLGIKPKDTDFCTDANPQEQISIYTKYGYHSIPTGIDHGTISVLLDGEIYEITSLRTEQNHDGRHADVSFTRDWIEDLSRRDLTFNAMSMTFEGELIDPFNGLSDLKAGRCVFVGNAYERLDEDYLRILRWFRFYGRFGGKIEYPSDAINAIRTLAPNLSKISRERIWQEMSKIVMLDRADEVLTLMETLGVDKAIGTDFNHPTHATHANKLTNDPFTVLIMVVGRLSARRLPTEWKLSRDDAKLIEDLEKLISQSQGHRKYGEEFVKEMLAWGYSREAVKAFLIYHRDNIAYADFQVPNFPVNGNDLLATGKYKPGPEMGAKIKSLKSIWIDSDFKATKDDLLKFA